MKEILLFMVIFLFTVISAKLLITWMFALAMDILQLSYNLQEDCQFEEVMEVLDELNSPEEPET